jgi:hypothetical protein
MRTSTRRTWWLLVPLTLGRLSSRMVVLREWSYGIHGQAPRPRAILRCRARMLCSRTTPRKRTTEDGWPCWYRSSVWRTHLSCIRLQMGVRSGLPGRQPPGVAHWATAAVVVLFLLPR